MGRDESGTLARLREHRKERFEPALVRQGGRLVKLTGDGALAEFPSAVDALGAAIEFQQRMAEVNREQAEDTRIVFRIGLHLGDLIVDGEDLYGDGVNVAARLEGEAPAGGILISRTVKEAVEGRLKATFQDLGALKLKNIERPMRTFQVAWNTADWPLLLKAAPLEPAMSTPPVSFSQPTVPSDRPSVAVLPFDNMSKDPEQEHFADGVVESLTAALSHIRSFFVVARNSAFTYKGRSTNVRDIGRELGVAYVLEGSVQRSGSRVRITVQLVETAEGAHLWAEKYDGSLDDIFDLQDRITEQVAGALQPSIRIAEIERSRRKRPQDLGAYDYAMRAMPHVWALEKDESAKALELLDKAIAIDPEYPLALSLAGWCHAQRSVYNWSDDIAQSQASARSLAERAAEMSGDDPVILAVLGAVHTFLRNYGTARVLLERAVTLDSNAAWAWSRLGWLENYTHQPQKAIENFERALRLSPIDPMNFNNYAGIGAAYEVAEEYDKATAFYQRVFEERPNASWIYRSLVSSLSAAGRMDEAKKAFAEMMHSYPDLTVSKFKQAMVFSPTVLNRMGENLRKLGLPE